MIDLCVNAALPGPPPAAPPDFPWSELLQILPHLLWALLALFALVYVGRDAILRLFGNVSKISVAGVEFELKKELEAAAAARSQNMPIPVRDRLSRRIADSKRIVEGAKVLWVDDHPESILHEYKILSDAGANVVVVTSTEQALDLLAHNCFDLAISDISRGDDTRAGLTLESKIQTLGAPPLIFYVGQKQATELKYAFGIADRPDELLHLVLDSLARSRG